VLVLFPLKRYRKVTRTFTIMRGQAFEVAKQNICRKFAAGFENHLYKV
jgi:hypothetical protein